MTTDDARIWVFHNKDGESCFEMLSKSEHKDTTSMSTALLEFLLGMQDLLEDGLPDNHLRVCTHHIRDGAIFHEHPNYCGQGPWKDRAIFAWGPGCGGLPGHIHCFVDPQGAPDGTNRVHYGGAALKDCVCAVVESSALVDDPEQLGRSDLFVPFLKEVEGFDGDNHAMGQLFYLAETEAIVEACAMIPDIGGPPNQCFLVKSRDRWIKEFTDWVMRPHHEDDMTDNEDED